MRQVGHHSEPYAPQAEQQIVVFRWLALGYVVLIANFLTPYTDSLTWFNALAASALVYNGVLDLTLRRGFWRPWLPYLTTGLDMLYCAMGSALTGGVLSDIRNIYFFLTANVALRFNLRLTLASAVLSILTFALIALPAGVSHVERHHVWVFALSICFFALLSGLLAEQIIRSRDRLDSMVCQRTSELALATSELQKANQHLRNLDQLKNEFVNTVTHELRTPLTSIRGYAEFLEDELGGPLTPEQQAYTEQIRQGSERLQHLVDDLLDVARLEAGTLRLNLRQADLGDKVQEVVKSLDPLARAKGVELMARIPAELPGMRMDPERIGQVLTNLVGNAIKFTPPGGRISVGAVVAPDEVTVEVVDTGIGIPREHLPHLFQKFYRVDPSLTRETGGAGLGLAIVQSLIEGHGGTLGAESELGKGSTFWFRLPLTESDPS